MSLYEKWEKYGEDSSKSQEEYTRIVEDYLIREKNVYEYLLSNKDEVVQGTISELGKKFDMDEVEFLGFVDGINESIANQYDLTTLTGDSEVVLDIDFRKLYVNMLDVSAEWLYNLEQWNDIIPLDERIQMRKDYNRSKIVIKDKKVGRNEPCPCNSGKKYKKCCGR